MIVRSSTLSLLLCTLAAVGCSKADTLTVKPGTPGAVELVPSPRLEQLSYKKILLLPYEGKLAVTVADRPALRNQTRAYYTSKIEKGLLSQGFEVISPEIVARAKKSVGRGASAAERAMNMGKETQAHAVFMIQSIAIEPVVDFYRVQELDTTPIDAAKVEHNPKKDEYFDQETKDCVFRLSHYAVRMEAKLIDVETGNVLWVGSGRQTAVEALPESYVAGLDKECKVVEQNFVFDDRVAGEGHLATTFNALVGRLLTPLKSEAHKGKAIVARKKKPPPEKKVEPKPEPPKVEKPKAITAVVSTKKASVRAGPGRKNERLRYVSRKTRVTVKETMGEWSKVELQDGTQGWMHESTIIVHE